MTIDELAASVGSKVITSPVFDPHKYPPTNNPENIVEYYSYIPGITIPGGANPEQIQAGGKTVQESRESLAALWKERRVAVLSTPWPEWGPDMHHPGIPVEDSLIIQIPDTLSA